jgi:hypothetical protein
MISFFFFVVVESCLHLVIEERICLRVWEGCVSGGHREGVIEVLVKERTDK